jgi:hypothetical protein
VFDSNARFRPSRRDRRDSTETTTIGGSPHQDARSSPRPVTEHAASRAEAGHGKEHWPKAGLAKALENPEYYLLVMFGWGHRLAVLLLPMLGLSLALVYLNKRQYFIYDHLLVATNLLSFAFLTNALGLVLPDVGSRPVVRPVDGLDADQPLPDPARGLRLQHPRAIIKTLIVWWSTMFSFVVLLGGLLVFALAQI